MPRPSKTGQRGDKANTSEDGGSPERFSAVTENYLLCLYKLWEESVTPTVTLLTDTIKELPSTEGLGSSVPSVARHDPPNAETGAGGNRPGQAHSTHEEGF